MFPIFSREPLQPGCWSIFCSHSRAYYYFAESVYPGNERNFLATKCSSLSAYRQGRCENDPIPMGIATPHTARGSYFLETNKKRPFGKRSQTRHTRWWLSWFGRLITTTGEPCKVRRGWSAYVLYATMTKHDNAIIIIRDEMTHTCCEQIWTGRHIACADKSMIAFGKCGLEKLWISIRDRKCICNWIYIFYYFPLVCLSLSYIVNNRMLVNWNTCKYIQQPVKTQN